MFYLFACTELDKQVEPGDALLARDQNKRWILETAQRCNAIECYVMNANDIIVWQSWPEETNH